MPQTEVFMQIPEFRKTARKFFNLSVKFLRLGNLKLKLIFYTRTYKYIIICLKLLKICGPVLLTVDVLSYLIAMMSQMRASAPRKIFPSTNMKPVPISYFRFINRIINEREIIFVSL